MHDVDNNSRLATNKQLAAHLSSLKTAERADQTARITRQGTSQGTLFHINHEYQPIQYDLNEIEHFLDVVFHVDLVEGESVLCYHDYGHHNRAVSESTLVEVLERSRKPARLYYATATAYEDEDGTLRNKIGNFCRFHVLVLDDIGTKVPPGKILLDPTYIIESSPDNFQYGYVLKQPLESIDEAQALVDLVYSSGLSDEGGKLATKKVRLPQGINGKRGANFAFRSRLHTLKQRYFTPQTLLDGLGINQEWSDVVHDALEVRRRLRIAGTSHWSPVPLMMPFNGGIVDPVAEWLASENRICNISGDWLEIECPWHDEHSDPAQRSAYYSPIGLGEGAHIQKRAFYCHHSHPESTLDFLSWVASENGPEAPVYDPSAELVSSHVFDAVGDTVFDIKSALAPIEYGSTKAFQQAYCKKLMIKGYNPTTGKARIHAVAASELWAQHPARVVVRGTTYAPSTTARLVLEDNTLKLNQFCMPDYGTGTFDPTVVERFLGYLDYLVPSEKERELFIDWLAAKFQNMSFRGWGILMVAPQQRTGRGTLITMLMQLFYEANCTQIPMHRLISSTDDFNEWEARALVFVGESEAMSFHGHRFYAAYNRLKDVVDTTVRRAEINHKYGRKEYRNVYTSFLMCANETLALTLDKADQRFYVIQNNPVTASMDYFSSTRQWMEQLDETGRPAWCKHVARFLNKRAVDLKLLNGPAPSTALKQEILQAARSPLDIALDALLDALPGPFFPSSLAETVLVRGGFSGRLELDGRFDSKVIRTEMIKRSIAIGKTIRVHGVTTRCRARVYDAAKELVSAAKLGTETADQRDQIRKSIERIDYTKLKKIVEAELNMEGF